MQDNQSSHSLALPLCLQVPGVPLRKPITTREALVAWLEDTVWAVSQASGEESCKVREKVLLGLFQMPLVVENFCYNVANPVGCALYRLQHAHLDAVVSPSAYADLQYLIYYYRLECENVQLHS